MSEQFEKSIRTLELPRVLQLLSEQAVSAEAKRRAMWARIPRLAELDGVLSRTGSRIMAAAAAGGMAACRVGRSR